MPSSRPARPARASLTQADFDKYQTRELAPVECDYRGYQVDLGCTAKFRRRGHLRVSTTFSRATWLKDLGFRSAQATHFQIEAMRHAYVDRNSYLGDPDFVKNPLEHLIDK